MKQKKNNFIRICLIGVLVLFGTFIISNCKATTVQAASSSTMKSAYKNYISKNKKNIRAYAYANIEISQNKPALLIVKNEYPWPGGTGYYEGCDIYYYIKGKVKKVGHCYGARPISLYQKNGKNYIWNGTSSDRNLSFIKNNKVYINFYCNMKCQNYKTQKRIVKADGMCYYEYCLSTPNYVKETQKYKEIKMIKFHNVR